MANPRMHCELKEKTTTNKMASGAEATEEANKKPHKYFHNQNIAGSGRKGFFSRHLYLEEELEGAPKIGTAEQVRTLISFRDSNEDNFTRKKYAAKQLWEKLIKELDLQGKVTPTQVSKKWENLKKQYKDLKTPKSGSGTDSGEVTAATWAYYGDMHAVLGARPSIEPPVLIASCGDPKTILMNMVEPCKRRASASSSATEEIQDSDEATPAASTASASSACTSTTCASPPMDQLEAAESPSPSPRKKKKNPVLEFLKAESIKEQQRHEEYRAENAQFLNLFQQMIDKMPDKQ